MEDKGENMNTLKGGEKLRKSMIAKHGSDAAWRAHMRSIASKGGKNGAGEAYRLGGEKATGFAADPEHARIAGKKGGQISKRRKVVTPVKE